MKFDQETLYNLLPAIYRIRDKERGGPLKALIGVIAEQVSVLEEDIVQFYDDQFIETCAEWIVPYIGNLIGARTTGEIISPVLSQRALVANTIAYRRRKGTAAVLEQLARDITGWEAQVVESCQRPILKKEIIKQLSPKGQSCDFPEKSVMETQNIPFDILPHTMDVRKSTSQECGDIPYITLCLWRLRAYPVTDAQAFKVDNHRYKFSVLGNDIPLFNRPQTERQITQLAELVNVPTPIKHDMLKRVYGREKSLVLTINGIDIHPDKIEVHDLSDSGEDSWANQPNEKYAIDPLNGRIALPVNKSAPDRVQVSYHYGFSSAMGGGEYSRADSFSVLKNIKSVPEPENNPQSLNPVQAGIDALGSDNGVVEIKDSGTYKGRLSIHAAKSQIIEVRGAEKRRPHLDLNCEWLIMAEGDDTEVTLSGLLISGRSIRISGKVQRLRIRHCTLVPGLSLTAEGNPVQPDMPSLIVEETAQTEIEIDHSIVGRLEVADCARVRITNSIVDATNTTKIAYAAPGGTGPGGRLDVKNSTIIGTVHTTIIELASNTIFLTDESTTTPPLRAEEVDESAKIPLICAERVQEGCVRFSYLPLNAQVPQRYNCHPEADNDKLLPKDHFTSIRYGHPGYCQLTQHCPIEIWQGADDEAEMGAFHDLYQPQRVINLSARLDEYLPLRVRGCIAFVTYK